MSQQPKKRILSSSSNYYAPKLPEDANLLTVSSDRISSDSHTYKATRSSSETSTSTRYPTLPDDLRAKLIHVGMNVRMNVSNGYKTAGTFPSFENGPVRASASQTVYEQGSTDFTTESPDESRARRSHSEGRVLSKLSRVLAAGSGNTRTLSSARKNLKRSHQNADLDAVESGLEESDNVNEESRAELVQAPIPPSLFSGDLIDDTQFVSRPNNHVQTDNKSAHSNKHASANPSLVQDDFEEADFLKLDQ